MLFEFIQFSSAPINYSTNVAAIRKWLKDFPADATVVGFWRIELGQFAQIYLLRSFKTRELMQQEQQRTRLHQTPFYITDRNTQISSESFESFDFLPDPISTIEQPNKYYEFRTYFLKPGGLAPLAGWKTAVPNAKKYTSHLITNMYALDGPTRIFHIWGFESLDERFELRKEHYGNGSWPPPGGPEQIDHATTYIGVPEKINE